MPKPASSTQNPNEYYFDSKYLQQYTSMNAKLKVFVDGIWLSVPEASDLESEESGTGYDTSNNPHLFDYREIQQIKAGGKTLTLDQLNQQKASEEEPAPEDNPEEPSEEPAEEPAPDESEPPAEEPAPEEEEPAAKGPQKSGYDPYMVGRNILNENFSKRAKLKELGGFIQITDKRSEFDGVRATVSRVLQEYYEVRFLFHGKLVSELVEKDKVTFI